MESTRKPKVSQKNKRTMLQRGVDVAFYAGTVGFAAAAVGAKALMEYNRVCNDHKNSGGYVVDGRRLEVDTDFHRNTIYQLTIQAANVERYQATLAATEDVSERQLLEEMLASSVQSMQALLQDAHPDTLAVLNLTEDERDVDTFLERRREPTPGVNDVSVVE